MGSYVAREQQRIIDDYKKLVEFYDSRHTRIGEQLNLIHQIISESNSQLTPEARKALSHLKTTADRMERKTKE